MLNDSEPGAALQKAPSYPTDPAVTSRERLEARLGKRLEPQSSLSPSPPSPPLQAALEGSCSLSARAALSPLLSLEQQLLGSHTVSLLPAPIRKSLLLTSLRATPFPF